MRDEDKKVKQISRKSSKRYFYLYIDVFKELSIWEKVFIKKIKKGLIIPSGRSIIAKYI